MAHKKKTSHKGHRPKRRKVSGMHEIAHILGQVVAAGVGGAVGVLGVNAVKTMIGTSMPATVPPLGAVVTGAAIAGFGKKVPYAAEFGIGMAAIGGVMAANEFGINMPGISGLAMASNAPAGSSALSRAVGCNKMGAGPAGYLSNTVGKQTGRRLSPMTVGALISN